MTSRQHPGSPQSSQISVTAPRPFRPDVGVVGALCALCGLGVIVWIALGLGRPLDAMLAGLLYVAAMVVAGTRPMLAVPVLYGYMIFNRLLRRLLDWSFNEYSELPPTSLLTTAVALSLGLLVVRDWKHLPRRLRTAMVLIAAGVTYGLLVGCVYVDPRPALFETINWVGPLAVLLFVLRLRPTPETLKSWIRIIAILTVIAGGYGWIQYTLLPPWDKFWVVNSGMGSIGQPEPFKVRFFGTFGAPGGMGMTCSVMVALLLMLRPFRYGINWAFIIGLGICGLSSAVRSSWLTAFLCLGVFGLISRAGDKVRIVAMVIVMILGVGIILPLLPNGEGLINRISTLSSVSTDNSFQGRVGFSRWAVGAISRQPWGYGMGSSGSASERMTGDQVTVVAFDNGFLQIPYALGLPGAALFVIGLVKLGHELRRTRPVSAEHQRLIRVAAALALGHIVALAVANFFRSDAAMLLYIVVAAAITAPAMATAPHPVRAAGPERQRVPVRRPPLSQRPVLAPRPATRSQTS